MTGVAVLIAARNAEATIAASVVSALAQPEAAEVVVVDDASTDATGQAARQAAAGDARLTVLRSDANIGPAAARNLAIARSAAPLIAVLDADDLMLPGRLAHLVAQPGWDLIADNIAFLDADAPVPGALACDPPGPAGSEPLELADFVRGNLTRRGTARGELGFLKPVMRRDAIAGRGLSYDTALWLGEDYDLYVRAMLAGARFRLTRRVGYVARVRAGSLSGRHRTADLAALAGASARHLGLATGGQSAADAAAAIAEHRRQVHARYLLRAFLDAKAEGGLGSALALALRPPANLLPIAAGVLADKLAAIPGRAGAASPIGRYLLPIDAPGSPASRG
ncbi:MAG: glycosyltransferase family 2 protein [Rhodobacteraceae bacterium]|nr:glycosyltransferase family 2 protein [Paracoccaceae bacterium]